MYHKYIHIQNNYCRYCRCFENCKTWACETSSFSALRLVLTRVEVCVVGIRGECWGCYAAYDIRLYPIKDLIMWSKVSELMFLVGVFIATGSRGRGFFLSVTRHVLCILTTQRAWCSCQRHLVSWNCEWQAARWRLMKWKALQTTIEIYRAHMKCCVKTGLVGRTAPCDSSVASIESIVSVDVCAVERSRRISATLFTSRRLRDAHQNIPKFNGLVSRKIYRKAPYLMGKSVVSCRFSL